MSNNDYDKLREKAREKTNAKPSPTCPRCHGNHSLAACIQPRKPTEPPKQH